MLFASFIVNDFLKLSALLYDKMVRYIRERLRRQREERRQAEERENEQLAIVVDQAFGEDLDERLEQFHDALEVERLEHENWQHIAMAFQEQAVPRPAEATQTKKEVAYFQLDAPRHSPRPPPPPPPWPVAVRSGVQLGGGVGLSMQ